MSADDFEVEFGIGIGKPFPSDQWVVWMTARHRRSGRVASGKIGTAKRDADRRRGELLLSLLGSFRRS